MRRRRLFAFLALSLLAWPGPVRAKDAEATDVTESGPYASLTTARGGDADADVRAFGVTTRHVGFGYERPATIRVINTLSIGGGARGIEGGFANAVAGGVRAPLGKTHGIVVRAGGEGSFFGNQALWDSLLELPQLQLGYQWLVPRSVADVALKGGYVLLGRHNTGDAAVRDLGGSPEWGGIFDVHLRPFDLRGSYTRIVPRDGGTPVELLEGALCGLAAPITLCTDVRYERGDVRLPDGRLRDARVSYVGLTIGIVVFETKPIVNDKPRSGSE